MDSRAPSLQTPPELCFPDGSFGFPAPLSISTGMKDSAGVWAGGKYISIGEYRCLCVLMCPYIRSFTAESCDQISLSVYQALSCPLKT